MPQTEWNLDRDGFCLLHHAVQAVTIQRLLSVLTMSPSLTRPTIKAGVPHVIASDAILHQILTLRIHLDEVTDENGPLRVIPGSHVARDSDGIGVDRAVTIHAEIGDVLAMRPLISHASGSSAPNTQRHRRILHLEFAASETLPDGYQWHDFVRPR